MLDGRPIGGTRLSLGEAGAPRDHGRRRHGHRGSRWPARTNYWPSAACRCKVHPRTARLSYEYPLAFPARKRPDVWKSVVQCPPTSPPCMRSDLCFVGATAGRRLKSVQTATIVVVLLFVGVIVLMPVALWRGLRENQKEEPRHERALRRRMREFFDHTLLPDIGTP